MTELSVRTRSHLHSRAEGSEDKPFCSSSGQYGICVVTVCLQLSFYISCLPPLRPASLAFLYLIDSQFIPEYGPNGRSFDSLQERRSYLRLRFWSRCGASSQMSTRNFFLQATKLTVHKYVLSLLKMCGAGPPWFLERCLIKHIDKYPVWFAVFRWFLNNPGASALPSFFFLLV
jgi:hypothetical protein